ncbi:MAG: hypothetical protein ACRD4F_17485 [Candidatus Angelobacter sp.]
MNTIILSNGTRYNYPTLTESTVNNPTAQPSTVTDANGNQITINATGAQVGWVDTMNRFIPGSVNGAPGSLEASFVFPGVPATDLSTCPAGTVSALL